MIALLFLLIFKFQSALPRGERLAMSNAETGKHEISIRAPTRGATNAVFGTDLDPEISIRAPTRGATTIERTYGLRSRFQSALPRGERPQIDRSIDVNLIFQSALPRGERHATHGIMEYWLISIRAPTRGATTVALFTIQSVEFQSALPRGERPSLPEMSRITMYFNPRSHEGSDWIPQLHLQRGNNFNPRSHEGSDKILPDKILYFWISIRAPTRGATPLLIPDQYN